VKTDIAIIGGGMAGLACAAGLESFNISYTLFEKSSELGGKVGSYTKNNCVVDKGFQVILPHYSACRKWLDYQALELKNYPSGATIYTTQGPKWFGHPFTYPKNYKTTTKVPVTFSDIIQLGHDVLMGYQWPTNTHPTAAVALNKLYSHGFYNEFLHPFFRGVFLDPGLNKSMAQFRYYLHCFFRKGAAIPKHGMAKIPNQLRQRLSPEHIQTQACVEKIEGTTVWINQTPHRFRHVVIATDAPTCFDLLNLPYTDGEQIPIFNYILSKQTPTKLAPLNLIAGESMLSHFNIPTLVSPSLAPYHYMNVTAFSPSPPQKIAHKIHTLTGESDWEFEWETAIPNASNSSPCPPKVNPSEITICGEWCTFPSIEGAIVSGLRVAQKARTLH
jgi:hypothetical protein